MKIKTVKAVITAQEHPYSTMIYYPCTAFQIRSDDPNVDLSIILKDMREKGPIFIRGLSKEKL